MTGRPDRRAEKRAWARNNRRALIAAFAAMIAAGLLFGKLAIVGAGIVGLIWTLLVSR